MRRLLLILAVGLSGALSFAQSAPQELAVDVTWCADAGGRFRAPPAFVWGYGIRATVRWQGPLQVNTAYRIEWVAPDGEVVWLEDIAVRKDAPRPEQPKRFLNLRTAKPGTWTVRVRWGGADVPPTVSRKFEVRRAAVDPNRPAFHGALYQGQNRRGPIGKATRFTTGHRSIVCQVETKTPPAAGNIIHVKLYRKRADKLELRAEASVNADGKGNAWSWPVAIAGSTWWSMDEGQPAHYAFRAFWNDDPTPILELPFELVVGGRRALVVVIADYPPAGPQPPGSACTDLPGNVHNLTNMKSLLVTGFGFPEKNITVLKDAAASRAAIVRELANLAAATGPADAALFYFCGHGLQVPDLNGDEPDGLDEALATAEIYPARMTTKEQLGRLLVDDRIAELLGKFRTKNVTVIIDSCHSGTAARAVLPPGTEDVGFPQEQRVRIEFGDELMAAVPMPGQRPAPGTRAQSLDVDSSFVFVSACQPWEVSLSHGLFGGYLTSNLAAALRDPRGRTWEEIFSDARNRVIRQNHFQTPTLDGARHRYPFTLEERDAAAPFVRPSMGVAGAIPRTARPQAGRSRVRVTDGQAGSHLALVSGLPGSETEFRGVPFDVHVLGDSVGRGQPVGRVRITGRTELSHLVRMVQNKPRAALQLKLPTAEIVSGRVQAGYRLIPLAVRVPDPTPTVSLRGNFNALSVSEKQRMQNLANTLARNREITYRGRGDISQFDYILCPSKDPASGKLSLAVFVSNSRSIASFAAGPGDSFGPVIDFIAKRHANHARLVRLSNPSPEFRFDAAEEKGTVHLKQGATIRLRLRASGKAGGKCYVTIVSGTGRTGLFPFGPGANIELPFNVDKWVEVPLHRDWRGRLVLKCFASTRRLGATGMSSFLKLKGAGMAKAVTDSLRRAHGSARLGSEFISTSGWADATLWFWVG